jgi:hypothetical protein
MPWMRATAVKGSGEIRVGFHSFSLLNGGAVKNAPHPTKILQVNLSN